MYHVYSIALPFSSTFADDKHQNITLGIGRVSRIKLTQQRDRGMCCQCERAMLWRNIDLAAH